MLPKDRVLAAFEHHPADQVPIYQGGFSSHAASHVLGREAYVGGGIQQYREACALWEGPEAHAEFLERSRRDAFDLIEVLDLDLVRVGYWRLNARPSARLDEHTFRYGDPEGAWQVMRFDPQTELYQVVGRSPTAPPTVADLEALVVEEEAAAATYQPLPEHFGDCFAALEHFGDHRAVPGSGMGLAVPREPVWLEACALRPELVGRLLDAQCLRAVRSIDAQAPLGLRLMMGGGDFAGHGGPFFSPRTFHELMLPRLQQISEACRRQGMFHMFASDGNLWPVADELFGASGVEGFYEVDRRAGMDLQRLRERFPHLTLLGGISSETLHLGTVEEVVAETRDALAAAHELGSIIVGCSNQVISQTPPGNTEAMMAVLYAER